MSRSKNSVLMLLAAMAGMGISLGSDSKAYNGPGIEPERQPVKSNPFQKSEAELAKIAKADEKRAKRAEKLAKVVAANADKKE